MTDIEIQKLEAHQEASREMVAAIKPFVKAWNDAKFLAEILHVIKLNDPGKRSKMSSRPRLSYAMTIEKLKPSDFARLSDAFIKLGEIGLSE